GEAGGSGIHAFRVRPRGASFELVGREQFVWSVLVTDCDFGPDGGFYLSDWVAGWGKPNKGRIYKVSDPERAKDPRVAHVKRLLPGGMAKRPPEELARLLGHADRRVRQEAQFALAASKGGEKILLQAAQEGPGQLARLHGLWGVGQIARKSPGAA